MKTEYCGNTGCLQRDSVEHEEYAGAHSFDSREIKETEDAGNLLERILSKDNMNRAYKRVKSNKGAAGIDGMTVEEALPWLREHGDELLESLRNGKKHMGTVLSCSAINTDNGSTVFTPLTPYNGHAEDGLLPSLRFHLPKEKAKTNKGGPPMAAPTREKTKSQSH